MPEGDTVHTLAGLIAGHLLQARLREGCLPRSGQALPRAVVCGVRASGKHLYIEFDSGHSLRTHLGLYGSWHRYAPGEHWQRPQRQASVVLRTEAAVLVCFNAAEAVLYAPRGDAVARAVARQRSGPDLTRGAAPAEVIGRARRLCAPDAPVVDALLDQRIAAGIGNVYKSEVLFLAGLDPATPLGAIDDTRLGAVFATAAGLLAANVHRARRRTRPASAEGDALWVYGRGGKPCLRCAAPILRASLGRHWRSCYWCPACQPRWTA